MVRATLWSTTSRTMRGNYPVKTDTDYEASGPVADSHSRAVRPYAAQPKANYLPSHSPPLGARGIMIDEATYGFRPARDLSRSRAFELILPSCGEAFPHSARHFLPNPRPRR